MSVKENIQENMPGENKEKGSNEVRLMEDNPSILPDPKEMGEQEITNQNSKIIDNDMEVQKHPHHVTHKKKWGEYLLEFFMLFLAVFLGFVAENFREHQVEKRQEKELIISFANDLQKDINNLTQIITQRKIRVIRVDSLIYLLNADNRNELGNNIYFNAANMGRRMNIRFTPNDGTMQQLKNAGGLRLVSNRSVVNSITQYDVSNRNLVKLQELEDVIIDDYRSTEYKVFNPLVFEQMTDLVNEPTRPEINPSLMVFSKEVLNEMNSRLHNSKLFNRGILRDAEAHLMQAKNLSSFLKKEYHLENE
jgi:hypothetical protein